ncbi:hypothetical protein Q8O96_30830 [Pseudomonas sp. LPH60]|uniref:OmpA family protein n=1 Tax=Pseudomonas sp. LPH60 TaxID=3065906 RepID=UPI00273B2161|nr:OmpA family protein [Pseudomonas sp. LPH60]MDP4573468.1 hypothetical protein [Pseudomonas sp. LPH60]
MRILVAMSFAVALTACSAPPKPPVVDGHDRQPVNNSRSQEIISLRADLARTQEQLRNRNQEHSEKVEKIAPVSQVVIVNFPYSSTQFNPSWSDVQVLSRLLPSAKHVFIRGRTDANYFTVADERIALGRALAAKSWVIAQGVPASKVSINYISGGDYLNDNTTNFGKTNNRRVEIEVYK